MDELLQIIVDRVGAYIHNVAKSIIYHPFFSSLTIITTYKSFHKRFEVYCQFCVLRLVCYRVTYGKNSDAADACR